MTALVLSGTKVAARTFLSTTVLIFTLSNTAQAMGKPEGAGGNGGGKPKDGGGDTNGSAENDYVLLGGDVISEACESAGSGYVRTLNSSFTPPAQDETNDSNAFFIDADGNFLPGPYSYTDNSGTTGSLSSYFDFNMTSDAPARARNSGPPIFNEEFANPSDADKSGSINWRRWSTKFPFATDAKINTIPGEDSHWNVNTTGRWPGGGVELNNFYGNISQFNFLDSLFGGDDPQAPVFQLVDDGQDDTSLAITAYTNPNPIRRINKSKPYLSGLISSHADPAFQTNPDNSAAHGFEFRYGYIEARIKLPLQGNGFRSAFWLYSDNAYYNQVSSNNNDRHEIDIMEFLPNSVLSDNQNDCLLPQPSLFGGVENTTRGEQTIMTYDAIFHTYHYNNGSQRTPTDWTFNSESRYASRRDAAYDTTAVRNLADGEYHTYGVLWEPGKIEWFVNDKLIHRVVDPTVYADEFPIPGFQDVAPVFNKRMYIIANLAMGLDVFEGENIDSALFAGKNPSMEIDYIKVWQNHEDSNWCGYLGERCTTDQ